MPKAVGALSPTKLSPPQGGPIRRNRPRLPARRVARVDAAASRPVAAPPANLPPPSGDQSTFGCGSIRRQMHRKPHSVVSPSAQQRETAGSSSADGERSGTSRRVTEETMGHATALAAFYGSLMGLMVWKASSGAFPVWLAKSGVAVLWAGMVLAISWMEAWVKFRAPLLAKHVGYDVGRHVFRGLNAMETALAGGLLGLCVVSGADFVVPAALATILGCQVGYLTPQLERAAFHKIVSATRETDLQQDELLKELRASLAGSSPPPKSLHVVYVVLEAVKVFLLLGFALSLSYLHLS